MIKLNTNMGTISIELDTEKAPNTTANFLQYAKDGFYDGTIFHRVITTGPMAFLKGRLLPIRRRVHMRTKLETVLQPRTMTISAQIPM